MASIVSRRAKFSLLQSIVESGRWFFRSEASKVASSPFRCRASNQTLHHEGEDSSPEWWWCVSDQRHAIIFEGWMAVPRRSRDPRFPTTIRSRREAPPPPRVVFVRAETATGPRWWWQSFPPSSLVLSGRRAGGKGSFPLDSDRWCRWYRLEATTGDFPKG